MPSKHGRKNHCQTNENIWPRTVHVRTVPSRRTSCICVFLNHNIMRLIFPNQEPFDHFILRQIWCPFLVKLIHDAFFSNRDSCMPRGWYRFCLIPDQHFFWPKCALKKMSPRKWMLKIQEMLSGNWDTPFENIKYEGKWFLKPWGLGFGFWVSLKFRTAPIDFPVQSAHLVDLSVIFVGQIRSVNPWFSTTPRHPSARV